MVASSLYGRLFENQRIGKPRPYIPYVSGFLRYRVVNRAVLQDVRPGPAFEHSSIRWTNGRKRPFAPPPWLHLGESVSRLAALFPPEPDTPLRVTCVELCVFIAVASGSTRAVPAFANGNDAL